MALRNYKYDNFDNPQKFVNTEKQTGYEDYQTDDNIPQLKDLLFFINIAIFAIASVLTIFILSALKMNSLLAFMLAIPVGIFSLKSLHFLLQQSTSEKSHKKSYSKNHTE